MKPKLADTVDKHPTPFSVPVIDMLRELIPQYVPQGTLIHDPFAGEGVRLGNLCDELGYQFSGVDLEPWKGRDPRVKVGDATYSTSYPSSPYVVCTSPTFNNGVNDHFAPKDKSRRLTYRTRVGRALHPNNTGRYSGRSSKNAEKQYWLLTRQAVQLWPDIVFVNVKDSYRKGNLYPLTDHWFNLLYGCGWRMKRFDVMSPGWKVGTNNKVRAPMESILIGTR